MRFSERRQFLKNTAGMALGWGVSAAFGEAAGGPKALPNLVGYAAISWPDEDFDQALKSISELGYHGVQMLGWVRDTYSEAKKSELKQQLSALKLRAAALSCSKVRLDPNNPTEESAEIESYAKFQKDLGGLYLQVTDRGRPGREYSIDAIKGLADRMNALGQTVQSYGLELGYHPHFGTLGETREGLGRILEATNPKSVKLIADVAHLTLGGADPAEVIRTYHQRLVFCHFKDVRRDVAELARQSRDLVRKSKFHFTEIGTGIVNYPAILDAFRAVKFRGWVIVELDGYQIPPGGPAESARINTEAMQKMGFKI